MIHSGQLRYKTVAQDLLMYHIFHIHFFQIVFYHNYFLLSKYHCQYDIYWHWKFSDIITKITLHLLYHLTLIMTLWLWDTGILVISDVGYWDRQAGTMQSPTGHGVHKADPHLTLMVVLLEPGTWHLQRPYLYCPPVHHPQFAEQTPSIGAVHCGLGRGS